MLYTDNKSLVRSYYEKVLNEHDYAHLQMLLSPSFTSFLADETTISRDAYVQALYQTHNAFPDIITIVCEQVAEDTKVVTRWKAKATHTGSFLGIPASHQRITITGIHIHTIANGQFIEHREEINMLSVLQQLGVIQ